METASELIETLALLGVTVKAVGPDRLRIEPASKVPADLLPRIREAKPEILAAIRNRTVATPTPAKAFECRYDWIPGYRGLRLQCVAHRHDVGTATVFRMVSGGRDVLLEMRELGILTGQAMQDAQRVN